MMNNKETAEIVFAATAKIGGMFFQYTQSDIINRHNYADAKYRFAKNDE
jgi:hypothetical protein